MKTYTWDDIYDRAIDAGYGDDTLTAKDEARWQVRDFVLDLGDDDIEDAECPEYEIDFYCKEYSILFDINGNIVKANEKRGRI